jgi:hypothetical protein
MYGDDLSQILLNTEWRNPSGAAEGIAYILAELVRAQRETNEHNKRAFEWTKCAMADAQRVMEQP